MSVPQGKAFTVTSWGRGVDRKCALTEGSRFQDVGTEPLKCRERLAKDAEVQQLGLEDWLRRGAEGGERWACE